MTPAPSKTEEWFRTYSASLGASFAASALVAHSTSKGDARERQVLDLLRAVLPSRVSLIPKPTIIDASDIESRSFDVVIADSLDFPRLFAAGFEALMVESVRCVIEIKSTLNASELDDIFGKAESLRMMDWSEVPTETSAGLVTAFSYECDNQNLRFLDFAVRARRSGEWGVSCICNLNRGVFALRSHDGSRPAREPRGNTVPCLYESAEDSLLLFVYWLISWTAQNHRIAARFARYSERLLHSSKPESFDETFLAKVVTDFDALEKARKAMRGLGGRPFEEARAAARKAIEP